MDFLNPEQVLNQLTLRDDMMAADFGCGAGGWVIPLARKLTLGRVYAIDIQLEALDALQSKAESQKLYNIKTIRADLEQDIDSFIPEGLLDLVLISNLLFQVKDKEKVINQAKLALKPGGQLLVIDWKMDAKLGPEGKRVQSVVMKGIAEKIGLVLQKEIPAGEYHWGLLFSKS